MIIILSVIKMIETLGLIVISGYVMAKITYLGYKVIKVNLKANCD